MVQDVRPTVGSDGARDVAKSSFTSMISLSSVVLALLALYRPVTERSLSSSTGLRLALAMFAGAPICAAFTAYLSYIGATEDAALRLTAWYQLIVLGALLLVFLAIFFFAMGAIPIDVQLPLKSATGDAT